MFALPQPDETFYVGLTDEEVDGEIPDVPEPPEEDIEFLLRRAQRRAATGRTPRPDVVGAYAGLRPLLDTGTTTADLSRKHAVLVSGTGVVTVVGGKLTTYRRMAQDAVDRAVAEAASHGRSRAAPTVLPLLGAALARPSSPRSDAPPRLVRRFGTEAPAVLAEAVAVTGLPEDELLAPIAPGAPRDPGRAGLRGHPRGRGAPSRTCWTDVPASGWCPEDRELAVPAAEKVLWPSATASLGLGAVSPSSSSHRGGRPAPERIAPGDAGGLPVVAGDEQAVAEVDLAPRISGGRDGRPGGGVGVAGDQAPRRGVGAEDLAELGAHLGLGLGARVLARHGHRARRDEVAPGRGVARRDVGDDQRVRDAGPSPGPIGFTNGIFIVVGGTSVANHQVASPRIAGMPRPSSAEAVIGSVATTTARAWISPPSVKMRSPHRRCAFTPSTSTPCSTGCSRPSASWLGSACMPSAGRAGSPSRSACMLSMANW